jgi:hypothetical protein
LEVASPNDKQWADIGFFGPTAEPADYVLGIQLFNDGDSDFGLSATASDILYEQLFPNNSPVNLEPLETGNTDLVRDEDDPDLYTYNPSRPGAPADDPRLNWPIVVEGNLLEPGEESSVVINGNLGCLLDTDLYSFRLEEGQGVTVNIDSETLFGRDDMLLSVAIYNGDFEALATIREYNEDDVLLPPQAADPFYQVQAISTIPNHESVVIDPMENGVGNYYVEVSGYAIDGFLLNYDPIPYQLTIETTEPEPIETPPSQLVWLAFDGAEADYLFETADSGWGPQVVDRPAFDAEDFDLGNMRSSLIEAIATRIEEIYRNAGLDEDEMEFTTIKPGTVGSPYPPGSTYSTVVFGGKLPGLLGIAERVDRHNSDRSDTAVVLTGVIADGYMREMSDDSTVRFEQTVNAISNIGAHELGHTLGLEHATEINTSEPHNIIGYNYDQVLFEQEMVSRSSYELFAEQMGFAQISNSIGFENEIDLLLRYIGSGTVMGA